ncbi:MAG: rhomboid family intramembrane serine protease [Allomuricauda sp.]|nr:MAG: rhomboid family intramembrane serine protease [Allomuricauda sp.]
MKEQNSFKFSNWVLLVPMVSVLLIWGVYWIEIRLGINLNDWGIFPRRISGLKGIFFSPFIHGSLEHLYNNTLPLIVLTAALFYFYKETAFRVLLIGFLLSGLFTWLIGRTSYHIGASGLIYVLASFVFFKGIFARHYRLVALSLAVVFLYGGLIWYIFPIKDGISWEGHLSGFLTGLLLAAMTKTKVPEEPKYNWEKEDYREEEDEFMKHFDDEGNFIENLPEDESPMKITYHYKRTTKNRDD